MYKCECCGNTFYKPLILRERNVIEGHFEEYETQPMCIFCESPYIKKFDPYDSEWDEDEQS